MRTSTLMLLIPCLLIAACGENRPNSAAEACDKAIAGKLAGKTFSIDRADMARNAKSISADTFEINSTIVFDKGLSTEYQQTFDCRVRMESGKAPDVLYMQFNWSKDDMKRVNEG
jgi:hypothetical protein